ncbi:dTDP-glucose 4,6-dehydratase, partial [Candidatus Woesearchaeota archaeon]|nr:dTDP-glucose 4,6-dehydratase [Candidatus Woesearchaeota archaeon]
MKAYFYLLIVLMVLLGGCSQNQEQAENNDTQPVLKVEPVNLSAVKIDKTELSSFYKLESLEVELKVPEYKLPLKENQIKNYANFNN